MLLEGRLVSRTSSDAKRMRIRSIGIIHFPYRKTSWEQRAPKDLFDGFWGA